MILVLENEKESENTVLDHGLVLYGTRELERDSEFIEVELTTSETLPSDSLQSDHLRRRSSFADLGFSS